jgi:hypothetical protein
MSLDGSPRRFGVYAQVIDFIILDDCLDGASTVASVHLQAVESIGLDGPLSGNPLTPYSPRALTRACAWASFRQIPLPLAGGGGGRAPRVGASRETVPAPRRARIHQETEIGSAPPWRKRRSESMSNETVPQVMINAVTGERQTIQLTPRKGLTVADVGSFRAERREAAKAIDLKNCTVTKYYTEALDVYGLFDVPGEWCCVGNARFVRNLPDGDWVWFGDLPEATVEELDAMIKAGHFRRDGAA